MGEEGIRPVSAQTELGSTVSSSTIQEASFDAYASIQNDEWDQT